MRIQLPDIDGVIQRIVGVQSTVGGETKSIQDWVNEHKQYIETNRARVSRPSDRNDIKTLLILISDLLQRATQGTVLPQLRAEIRAKEDLRSDAYARALRAAGYRWVEEGRRVISEAVDYFARELNWNWREYFAAADKNCEAMFENDYLLTIKCVKFKVRNLALSNFSRRYAAFDRHLTRVVARIGILNYGFDLLGDREVDIGTDLSDRKTFRFFHRLFMKLSDLTDRRYEPVDLDKIFWHFGRTVCTAKRDKCSVCPIQQDCLTGRNLRL
jgi:hypothetical protein